MRPVLRFRLVKRFVHGSIVFGLLWSGSLLVRAAVPQTDAPASAMSASSPSWPPLCTIIAVVASLSLTALGVCQWVQRRTRPNAAVMQRFNREAALEQRYRDLIENSYDIIYTHDLDGNFTSLNRAGEKITGYSREEGLRMNIRQLFSADQLELLQQMTRKKTSGQSVTTYEVDALTKFGNRITLEVSSLLIIENGKPVGVQGIARDITERKRSEQAVRIQEEFISQIINAVPSYIFVKDREGRFTLVNRATAEFYGLSASDMVGKTDVDLNPNLEDVQHYQSDDRHVIETGVEKFVPEERVTNQSGEIRWLQTVKRRLLAVDGNTPLLLGVSTDVTQHKRKEEELRQAQSFLNSVIENLPIPVFLKEPNDLRFILWNKAGTDLIGYAASEIIGKDDYDLFPKEQADFFAAKDREAFRTGRLVEIEQEKIQTRSNGTRILRTKKIPLFDHSGKPLCLLGICEDITSQKETESALRQAKNEAEAANRIKGEFLANMSHEIRTPMNAIIGMTSLLIDSNLNSEQRSFAETVRQSAEGLLTLINDILDFSKIEAGKLHFEMIDFNPRETIETTLDLLSGSASRKRLKLASQLAPEIDPMLRGDPGRLRQVLINLIGNAIKFTGQGQVTVSVTLKSRSSTHAVLLFEVTDTGIGIPPEVQHSLFQPFIQADTSTTRKFGGTGLGLAISRRIVKLMHGHIGVRSTVGQGSTFWFTARFAKPPRTEPESEAEFDQEQDLSSNAIANENTARAPLRILVAEDNPANQKVTLKQLERLGHHAVAVANGLEVLAAVEKIAYDIILMDCQMPEMDGYEATRRLRQNPRTESIVIIAVTANAMYGDQEKCIAAGMNDYVCKPVRLAELSRLIEEWGRKKE